LFGLLNDSDAGVARAAALSLGTIGGMQAVTALRAAMQAGSGHKNSLIDALLACAESLRNASQSAPAMAISKLLAPDEQARLVRLAATRGMLACGGQS